MSTMYGSVKVVSAPSPSHAHAVDGERKEVSPGQLEAFGVEGGVKEAQMEVYNQQSLHPVGQDPWWIIGFHFVVALNNILVLGYPYLILVPLGWYVGTSLWIVGMVLAYYCNTLLAAIHEYGGVRHIRHRDLAHHIYGPAMYKVVFFLQYSNLYVGDIGLLIVAGQTLKAIYVMYTDEPTIQLAYWIAVAGVVFGSFAIAVPNMHNLRLYSTISIGATVIYGGIAMVIAIQNGLDSPPRDYSVQGTTATRVFSAIAAITTIGYSFNTTILPEIQSTVKPPTAKNTYKALRMQIYASNPIFMILSFVSYWAYGSSVEPVLLNSLRGPKVWIAAANAAAFIQAVISLHLFVTPIYELIDTRFGRMNEGDWSVFNTTVRVVGRSLYMISSAFLGALLPLFGDFVVVTGALSIWPLEFVLANHMYLKVTKDLSKLQRCWHWMLVWFTSLIAVVSLVAGVRYLIVDSIYYKAFADL